MNGNRTTDPLVHESLSYQLMKGLCAILKVVIEGLVERKSWGDIAVDDIKVLNGLSMTDCKGETFTEMFIDYLCSIFDLTTLF